MPVPALSAPTPAGAVPADLELFCSREYPKIRGALHLYVGNEGVAAELVQETFVRVCRDWHRVSVMAQPGAWAHRVAMNLANSWFRRRKAERRAQQRDEATVGRRESIDPSTPPAVIAALRELRPQDRAVLVLRFYADLTLGEVADALGIPEGTAKTRARHGIARLRTMGILDEDEEVSCD